MPVDLAGLLQVLWLVELQLCVVTCAGGPAWYPGVGNERFLSGNCIQQKCFSRTIRGHKLNRRSVLAKIPIKTLKMRISSFLYYGTCTHDDRVGRF